MIWDINRTKTFIFVNIVLMAFAITGIFPNMAMFAFVALGAAILITANIVGALFAQSRK